MRKLFLAGLSLTLVLATSCTKKYDIGTEAFPDDYKSVVVSDSLELLCYTVKDIAGRTDESVPSLLGTFNDPVFGKSSAELYSQFVLPLLNFKFKNTALIADSVVLTLSYTGFQGDKNSAPQKVNVYVLTQEMYRDSSYSADRKISHGSSLLGTANFSPISNTTDSSVIRIKLDNTFAQYLLNIDPAKMTTPALLAKEFKGLCITVDSNIVDAGALFKFNLNASNSRIRLHYHDTAETMYQDYYSNSDAAWSNYFNQKFSTFANQHVADTSKGNDEILLKGMYGLKAFVKIKNIEKLKALMPIAINKATLSMKSTNTNSSYALPQNLLVKRLDAVSFSGVEYLPGSKEYRTNIPSYIQGILDGKIIDKGLELMINPIESASSTAGVVLGGSKNASGYKMKIQIIYTKI